MSAPAEHRATVVALALLLLLSCDRSRFPGFKHVADGIDLRLHELGEGEVAPTDSDSICLRVRVAKHGTAPGSFFSTDRWYEVRDTSAFRQTVVGSMVVGDSVSVIAQSDRIPWAWIAPEVVAIPPDSTCMDLELRLIELLTPQQVRDRAAARRAADPDGYERRLLEPFTDPEHWTAWGELVHYHIDFVGADTTMIRTGDQVTVHYQGRFTDGRVFDDTHRSGQPFTFRLGDAGQVINGIEMAVHQLRKGGRGTFAMRSSMAFGAKGSSTGQVPPFTPVVYEVEVIDLVRAPL